MLKVHYALLSDTVTSREFVHTNSISASKIAEKENRVFLTVKSVMNTRYGTDDRTRFNHCVAGALPRQQQSPGLLHLDGFESRCLIRTKKERPFGLSFLRKSNQTEQNRGKSKQKYTSKFFHEANDAVDFIEATMQMK